MQRADSLEKSLMLGKIEGRRRRGRQRIKWLGGIINSMDMSLSKLWEMVKDREPRCAVVHGVAKRETQLSGWNNNKKPCMGASQVVLVVKNWPVNAEDPWVRKILEEGMTTHSSIFAWRIPWTEELGGLQSTGSQRVRHN